MPPLALLALAMKRERRLRLGQDQPDDLVPCSHATLALLTSLPNHIQINVFHDLRDNQCNVPVSVIYSNQSEPDALCLAADARATDSEIPRSITEVLALRQSPSSA